LQTDQPTCRVVRFDRGTLLLENWPDDDVPDGFLFDPRVRMYRAQAQAYHRVILDLHRRKIPFDDQAREYANLDRTWSSSRVPRYYQDEAVEAWREQGRRGCVILPTGAGKSFVAELCIQDAGRSTLVVAPTIDLVGQWYDGLRRVFGEPVGVLGGGVHEVHDITVSTYDSAWMHMERYGGRFGLVIFDEVHHLPGPSFSQAALQSIAPFRLGLTATLERPDDGHLVVFDLVGPICYRREITDLAGDFLAEYRTEVRQVHLTAAEREAYQIARATFRDFVDAEGIRMGGRNGWSNFLRATARSSAGRAAFKGWQESRRLLQAADSKLQLLAELLVQHADGRVIIFTNDNATVYAISRALLIPAITHQTELKERRTILEDFASGKIPAIATARVLNEGVDIPAADVAIVLSGTQTVREHVQRLGRILRKVEGKQAILYELVVADSVEERQSARRREHVAYKD
jgi:superfamily II DNA or RNA helicase